MTPLSGHISIRVHPSHISPTAPPTGKKLVHYVILCMLQYQNEWNCYSNIPIYYKTQFIISSDSFILHYLNLATISVYKLYLYSSKNGWNWNKTFQDPQISNMRTSMHMADIIHKLSVNLWDVVIKFTRHLFLITVCPDMEIIF